MNSNKLGWAIGVFLVCIIGYRAYQFKDYMGFNPNKSLEDLNGSKNHPEKYFKKVIVKKAHSADIKDNEKYTQSALDVPPIVYNPADTLFLKEEYREAVEFEVLSESTIRFTDLEIIKDPTNTNYDYREGKPWHRRDRDSYAIGNSRAIWVFFPWLYGTNVKVNLTFTTEDATITKVFPISVLDSDAYAKMIESRLSEKDRLTRARIIKKYKSIMAKYWGYKEFGTGRKASYSYVWNGPKFQKEHPNFKDKWVYSNQYVAIESGFRIILTVGTKENIEVEPIN